MLQSCNHHGSLPTENRANGPMQICPSLLVPRPDPDKHSEAFSDLYLQIGMGKLSAQSLPCQPKHTKVVRSTQLRLTSSDPALLTFTPVLEPIFKVLFQALNPKRRSSTKMRFFTIAASFLAVASASALPERRGNNWHNWNKCLSQDQANSIVDQFIVGLLHPDVPAANATLQALLADDFKEISDSILSLEGQPVCSLGTLQVSSTDQVGSLAEARSVASKSTSTACSMLPQLRASRPKRS